MTAENGHRCRKPVHGYKAHVATDQGAGLIRGVEVTTANKHGASELEAILPDAPGDTYGDSADQGDRPEGIIRAGGGRPRIVHTGGFGGAAAAERLRVRNAEVSRVRCRIERMFGTAKRSYGLRRMRWLGDAVAGTGESRPPDPADRDGLPPAPQRDPACPDHDVTTLQLRPQRGHACQHGADRAPKPPLAGRNQPVTAKQPKSGPLSPPAHWSHYPKRPSQWVLQPDRPQLPWLARPQEAPLWRGLGQRPNSRTPTGHGPRR